jgi:hypothetical protein
LIHINNRRIRVPAIPAEVQNHGCYNAGSFTVLPARDLVVLPAWAGIQVIKLLSESIVLLLAGEEKEKRIKSRGEGRKSSIFSLALGIALSLCTESGTGREVGRGL